MNVVILGSGGREHALAKAVSKSKHLKNLVCIPGNPGMRKIAKCVTINPLDNAKLKEFCVKEQIDLIIPGSEVYLENGVHDAFLHTTTKVFGPTKQAALLETSKEFAKDFMKKYNIPTASYQTFDDYQEAITYINKVGAPIVLKYDGLAGGKGVLVCMTKEEALNGLETMLQKKKYGEGKVVIEEYLEGPEFSLMTFVHNNIVIPMPIAQDHKRLLNEDKGPNTGGMGIYSSVPIIPQKDIDYALTNIMQKTVDSLLEEGISYTGFLYGGLMNTVEGPKVIEFNARFGDPETEVILPKLETDFLDIITQLLHNKKPTITWNDNYYLGVVLASKGYPESYEKGYPIDIPKDIQEYVIHMGTKQEKSLVTNGGRVLCVLGRGSTLEEAQKHAYQNVSKISCDNLIYRTDIGYKALKG